MTIDKIRLAAALVDAMGPLHIAAKEALESRNITSFSMHYFPECALPFSYYVHAFDKAFQGHGNTPGEALMAAINGRDEFEKAALEAEIEALKGENKNG